MARQFRASLRSSRAFNPAHPSRLEHDIASIKRIFLILACTAILPGCASIISGTQQSVSVVAKTPAQEDVVGAKCSLSNTKGEWFVNTPGSVTVHRGYGVLTVACDHADWAGQLEAKSTTKAAAFGNIIFGGGIGLTVDMVNGAAYDYPQLISVGMQSKAPGTTGNATPLAMPVAATPAVSALPVAAPPATVVPAAAMAGPVPAAPVTPPPRPATPTSLTPKPATPATGPSGEDAYTVEHLDEVRQCNRSARSTLVGNGPGFASYSVVCNSGDVLAVRCEFGNCRVLH